MIEPGSRDITLQNQRVSRGHLEKSNLFATDQRSKIALLESSHTYSRAHAAHHRSYATRKYTPSCAPWLDKKKDPKNSDLFFLLYLYLEAAAEAAAAEAAAAEAAASELTANELTTSETAAKANIVYKALAKTETIMRSICTTICIRII